MLSPQDWLLQIDSGWKKLTTPEEIDAYVDRKISGPLFVFDGIEKREDKQFLLGTLFNSTRTDMQAIEIPMQKNNKKEEPPVKMQPKLNSESKRDAPQNALPSPEIMRGRTQEEES